MKLTVIAQCAWTDLKASPRRLVLSLLGVSLGLAALLMVSGLSLGLEETVDREFHASTDIRRVEVRKQGLDLGIVKLDPSALFGGDSGISAALINELRALDTIAEVYPRLDIGLPMGARGGEALLGKSLYADLLLEGLPARLLSPTTEYSNWTSGEPVPIWISDKLVEIFNTTVAPSLKLPEISPALLNGFTFELIVGRSLLNRDLRAKVQGKLKAVIVGAHPSVSPLGASTTLEIAKRIRSAWAFEPPPLSYTSLLIDVKGTRHLDETIAQLEALGLEPDRKAQKIRQILQALKTFGLLVAGLFIVLAGFLVGQSFSAVLLERRRDLSLYRGLGFSRRDLTAMIAIQGMSLGLLGSLIGCLLGLVLGESCQWMLTHLVTDFPFKPARWFIWSGSALGIATFIGTTITTVAGLWPLRRLTTDASMLEDLH